MIIVYCLLAIIIFVLLFLSIFYLIPIKYPKPTESDYTYARFPFWYLYYTHKYIAAPIKRAARGSNLEHYFQNLPTLPSSDNLKNKETFTITSVGDLMYRRDMIGFPGEKLWEEIGEHVFNGDLSTGNLEFAVNPNNIIEHTVKYSAPEEGTIPLLNGPNNSTFDYLALGNNHLNDSGEEGINYTCNFLEKKGYTFSGANRTREEQDDFPIVNVNGISIAFLSYTFTHNKEPLAPGKEYMLNIVRFNALKDNEYDPSLIHRHIKIAKEKGAELIIANMHWGLEFEYYPPVRLVNRAHELCDAGIDMIIGHHPHIINLSDIYQTKDGRTCPIYYSLGSITTYALPKNFMKMALVAKSEFTIGTNQNGKKQIVPTDLTLIPTFYFLNKKTSPVTHRIVPLLAESNRIRENKASSWLTRKGKKDILKMEETFLKHFKQPGFKYL
jgi:poly-gamma-glutamate capsule biosynthesis protein CapA/YwtB (metallophosphatase superfamily)